MPLDNAFWKFSLAVYAAPGVPEECLAVQERYGVDVNVLLFCAWLAFGAQSRADAGRHRGHRRGGGRLA